MFRKFLLTLCLLFLPFSVFAQGDTGVQARVLPSNADVLLEIIDWSYENISDTEVLFHWESNLPAIGKIEYGDTWTKGQSLLTEGEITQHSLLLSDLWPGTLYYFNLSAYNDSDSVSLGDNTFRTSGQRKVLDSSRILDKKADGASLGASKRTIEIQPPDLGYKYKTDELFLLEDITVIFIIFSILLVLFLIYKKLRQQNEQKKSHWEKLDK